MMSQPHVLIVAGTDSSGGAGLVRDIETVSAFGMRCCVAVTAVTVQTHGQFHARIDLPSGAIAQQMRAALTANNVKVIKIGMLARTQVITEICEVLRQFPSIPAILDPIILSTSGGVLLEPQALDALCHTLLPLCTLLTPNVPELALLTNSQISETQDGIVKQASILMGRHSFSILVKGGHSHGNDCVDILCQPNCAPATFASPRLSASLRGSGCILSSAMAAELAQGAEIVEAIRSAKRYVFDQLKQRKDETPDLCTLV